VRDTLQRIQLTPIVAFSRESFGLAKRASDSPERGSNALELVIFARLSDPGIAKLGQLLKTDGQLYLGIGTGCQNMIEAERIFMVHSNIHFLCASVWFRSGEVGVTRCSVEWCSVQWCSVERCSVKWCSGSGATHPLQCAM